ncbi:MAG: DNA-protecting protein DprA [Lactobacillus sp.]|uniref:DNA-processing protein DprA n=1 Tax=Limosilactobacillus coleohominis TaxID=181675 RepID=UPI002A9096C6|nr:DNA-processing protein DprA [Limosilactobacillus coleohominis]MCI5813102.1 DNA-protecting protein DprA [Lactobacillus sp.]MDY5628311.1 DNA-processing protein DprA [Limosilactobacillus coleohominis]
MQPKEFLVRLNVCRGIGIVSKYQLWKVAAERYEFNDVATLTLVAGITGHRREQFLKSWASQSVEEAYQRNRHMPFITIIDSKYPEILRNMYCPPLVLYFMGDIRLLQSKCLAVVGARKMSSYAQKALLNLLPPVIHQKTTIVSGLARGVDGLSHQIALNHEGKTVAVVANGLNRVYPPEHDRLQRMIKRHGLIVSEYPLDTPSLPHQFVERNRIIAGLSQACLIVEARKKSGSLITVNIALYTA